MSMSALLTLVLAAGVAAASPGPCSGPSLDQLAKDAAPASLFHFDGLMLPAFARLRSAPGDQQGAPPSFDRVTVLVAPDHAAAAVLFGRGGCIVDALRTTRTRLFQALLSAIGPAV
jgi:hypothetical protein